MNSRIHKSVKNEQGFTLVELAIVMVYYRYHYWRYSKGPGK